jgi:D-alanyl-D-alanine carboxypeptidase (penicillin-binding protein 5/6)
MIFNPVPRRRLALVLVFLAMLASADARAIDTAAREAILIDMTTGTALLEKNADARMPTASMSKIMTMFMVFEAIEQGRLRLDDTLEVSERAWKAEGSRMFIEVGQRVKVEDLVRGVIIQSGNDASIALAEGLDGSEAEFSRRMSERAHELGLTGSNFVNATGLPDPNHYSTPRDLARLAELLIGRFSQYYHYYSELDFTYNGITQQNRNPLLREGVGADGMKTGHTSEAGYGLVGTAVQNGRRLILVIGGLGSMREREEESVRLIEWGFREFDAVRLFSADDTVENATVWMGEAPTVPLVTGRDLAVTLPQAVRDRMRVTAVVDEPVEAPITRGARLGTLRIDLPDLPTREVPLFAGRDVESVGILGRIAANAEQLIFGGPQ